ncbi:MAG: hypothetical protein O3A26_02730 [Proteobacteria bacterium]|jgi:hypothetical protein|nr:hypothetical protein [Pseudomonadota bacterium]
MFRIEVETSKNSRIQNISEDQIKKFISPKLIEMLRDKLIHSVAVSKTSSVMYIFSYQHDA